MGDTYWQVMREGTLGFLKCIHGEVPKQFLEKPPSKTESAAPSL